MVSYMVNIPNTTELYTLKWLEGPCWSAPVPLNQLLGAWQTQMRDTMRASWLCFWGLVPKRAEPLRKRRRSRRKRKRRKEEEEQKKEKKNPNKRPSCQGPLEEKDAMTAAS